MRVSDLVKDVIFLVGSMECFSQVPSARLSRPRDESSPAEGSWTRSFGARSIQKVAGGEAPVNLTSVGSCTRR